MSSVVAVGFIVGLIVMIFYTPIKYAQGVLKICNGGDLYGGEKVGCFIPLYNVIHAERQYTGARVSKVLLGYIVMFVTLAARIAVIFLAHENLTAQKISIIGVLIGFAVLYAVNVYAVYVVLSESGAVLPSKVWVRSLIFPFGQYFIGTYLSNAMANVAREEQTF